MTKKEDKKAGSVVPQKEKKGSVAKVKADKVALSETAPVKRRKSVDQVVEQQDIFSYEVSGLIVPDELSQEININNCTPTEIVAQLDKYIIGQTEGKKAVAIAFRNRWRRMCLPSPMRDEIMPKNILMTGPTGVGKTEIARRLAKFSGSPFIKVEATKFTEVGYVGRDVDSIIRDLTDRAVLMVRERVRARVLAEAEDFVKEKIVAAILRMDEDLVHEEVASGFEKGEFADYEIEIELKDQVKTASFPMFDVPGLPGGGQVGVMNIGEMLGKLFNGSKVRKKRKLSVQEAFDSLVEEEVERLTDEDAVIREALESVNQNGIVFIDEIDKIVSRDGVRGEVNREGVQRDLLPLIEGTSVATKYGQVNTDHILFIASGAFHLSKPSDLLPELQGRLPIRVELNPLSIDDMVNILCGTEASLLKQYCALMQADAVKLKFTKGAMVKIASIAYEVNRDVENIGARRLHTIMEKLLEEVSFNSCRGVCGGPLDELLIDEEYVDMKLKGVVKKLDVVQFIL